MDATAQAMTLIIMIKCFAIIKAKGETPKFDSATFIDCLPGAPRPNAVIRIYEMLFSVFRRFRLNSLSVIASANQCSVKDDWRALRTGMKQIGFRDVAVCSSGQFCVGQ